MDTKLIARRRGRQGIILAVLFGLSSLLLILVVAMATLNVQTLSSSAREVYVRQAWYAADGGLQYALAQLNSNAALAGTVNGTLPTSGLSYRVQITNNVSGTVPVTSPDGTSVPVGYVWMKSTGTSQRTISESSVSLAKQGGLPVFSFALFSTGSITLSGGTKVDAYNSNVAPYTTPTTPQVNAPVGSSSGVVLTGGRTMVDGNIILGSGATVSGNKYTGTVQSNATMPSTPSVVPPSYSGTLTNLSLTSNTTLAPGTYGDLSVSGGSTLTLTSGTYYFKAGPTSAGNVTLSGNSILEASPTTGPVVIYVDGSWNTSGGSIVNDSGLAANLQLYGTSTCTSITMSGGSSTAIAVYAPSAAVTLSGGGTFFGAINAKSLSSSGGSFLHYDLALQDLAAAGLAGGGATGWTLVGVHRQ